jgi:pyruvate dehydrogenase E2 component (dihydrolipoamide acetyltransferase)
VLHEFRMPDAGEGLTEAEVLSWHVAVGDVVRVNQVLLEVETAKAAVELPSPYAGTVVALLASPGEVVPVGQPIIRIDDAVGAAGEAGAADQPAPGSGRVEPGGEGGSGAAGPSAPTPPAAPAPTTAPPPTPPAAAAPPAPAAAAPPAPAAAAPPAPAAAAAAPPPTDRVNAAFGGDFGTARLPAAASPPAQDLHGTAEGSPTGGAAAQGEGRGDGQRQAVLVGYGIREGTAKHRRPRATPHGAEHVEAGPPGEPARPVRIGGLELGRAVEDRLGATAVRAKPPVRRLARDLGIDLAQVVPTGPAGTITHDDVTRAAEAAAASEAVPLSHVARMMARAMTESAFSAPHVTEWVDVDVTRMTELIRAARARPDLADLSITPLTFAALGLVRAARRHPAVNATLADDGEHLLLHRSVHLGIAVDSPRGLVVPRVAEAQDLDLRGMADALGRLVATARAGRSRPEDLRGSTITITNVGVFGVDAGTPILNPGEVAILALGRVLPRPWVVDGTVVARDVTTLALSFDHRVVDGALGSRVLREVADFMADPATVLALG